MLKTQLEEEGIKIKGQKQSNISVNKEKKVIYFLLALDPSITISFLIEFFPDHLLLASVPVP